MAAGGFGSVSNGSKKILSPAVNSMIAKNIMSHVVVKERETIKNYNCLVAYDEYRTEKKFMKSFKDCFINEIIKEFKKLSRSSENLKFCLLNNFWSLFEARNENFDLIDDVGDLKHFKYYSQRYRTGRSETKQAIKKMFFYILTKKYFEYRKVKPLKAEKCLYFKNNLFNEFVNDYSDFYENFILQKEEDNQYFNERDGTNDFLDINTFLIDIDLFEVIFDAFNHYRLGTSNDKIMYGCPDGVDKIIISGEIKNIFNSNDEKIKVPTAYLGNNKRLKKWCEDYEEKKKRSFESYFNAFEIDIQAIFEKTCPVIKWEFTGDQPEILRTFNTSGNKKNKLYNDFSKSADF